MKNYMAVRGGTLPTKKDSIYRKLKNRDDIIVHTEHNGLFFREVLASQDVPLIREAYAGFKESYCALVRDMGTGKQKTLYAEQVFEKETDKEILEAIQSVNPDEGNVSLAVFDPKNKQFIALLDIMTVKDTDFKECAIEFLFTKNKLARKMYEDRVKKSVVEICEKSGMFAVCKEKFYNGQYYEFRKLSA